MNNDRFTIYGLIFCMLAAVALFCHQECNFAAYLMIAVIHFNTRFILDEIHSTRVEKASYGLLKRIEIN